MFDINRFILDQKSILIFIICFLPVMLFGSVSDNERKTNVSDFVTSYLANQTDTLPDIHSQSITLRTLLYQNDTAAARLIVNKLITVFKANKYDDEFLYEANYYIGMYYYFVRNYYKSTEYLDLAIINMGAVPKDSTLYSKANFNYCLALSYLGDYFKLEAASKKTLEIEKNSSDNLAAILDSYIMLGIAKTELQKYDEAISVLDEGLALAGNIPTKEVLEKVSYIYHNLGACYLSLADNSNAKLYLEKAERICLENNFTFKNSYINLLNSLSALYGNIGLPEKSDTYISRAIFLSEKLNIAMDLNILNTYAIIIGNAGNQKRGEEILRQTLVKSKIYYGEGSKKYTETVCNYATYLREYKIDNIRSLKYYEECLGYIDDNTSDLQLRSTIFLGYALSLAEAGRANEALINIQKALFSSDYQFNSDPFINPDIESIEVDKKSIRLLTAKYTIIKKLFKEKNDLKILESAATLSELIIEVLEKVRININEEESRLILGDNYKNSYLHSISDFSLLYKLTSDKRYLEKAFIYSEKSKVAGLLTATREMKASQFQIPVDVSGFELRLRKDIGIYNDYINQQLISVKPDTLYLNDLRERLLNTTRKRDSLILFIEKHYPEYYAMKYNTKVAELNDIPDIVGRNGNYINYISTDSILYVFVANRKYRNLLALPVDTSFFRNLTEFRGLLAMPGQSDNARKMFEKFVATGTLLYKKLISPVIPYLISNNLVISSDNILSYIPFDALPTSSIAGAGFSYRKLPYLMLDYDISYTYSATFMKESVKKGFNFENNLIAFAPDYSKRIEIQQVMNSRQARQGFLPDLPYAREEASYVSHITGGKVYLNSEALESKYKSEAGNFDIIHLAMHTILNDSDPMYSTLIFKQDKDGTDDGYLKTYELYGIPLKARMVVLSSCNTGSGLLSSGEGILSLARGFMYSGSQSVVMSLWEIEDKSGTEIVKHFYDNLKKGKSKSNALKNARLEYLKETDDLRSHPYFWSTLVIYGNNSSLFYNKKIVLLALISITLFTIILIIYLRKRRYS